MAKSEPKVSEPEVDRRIHAPTNGKTRRITAQASNIHESYLAPGGGSPSFDMTFEGVQDDGGAWVGHVGAGELRVSPAKNDDHVVAMQLAIEARLQEPAKKVTKDKP